MSSNNSNNEAPPTKERLRMRSEAEEALSANPHIDCPGFECSRVFALLDKLLRDPPAGITRRALLRNVNTIFQFVVRPTDPLDPSNPRTKPTKGTSGGALRPALWYIDLRKTASIAKGHPPRTILGTKRRADVTIECTDRDLLHLAQGQKHAQALYNIGRIKIKGDIDRALRIATLLNQERSRLFNVPPALSPSASPSAATATGGGSASNGVGAEYDEDGDYSSGAPAPIPNSGLPTGAPRSKL